MTWTVNTAFLQSGIREGPHTSTTITTPSNVVKNDLLFCVLGCTDSTSDGIDPGLPSFPLGWSFAQSTAFAGFGGKGTTRLTTAYKISTGVEPANFNVSWTNTAWDAWALCGTTPPSNPPFATAFDQVSINVDTATPTSSYVSNVLNGLASTSDLLFVVYGDCGGNSTYTMPGGLTTIFNNNEPNSNEVFIGWNYLVLNTGAASSFTATSSNSAFYAAVAVAFSAINFVPNVSVPNAFEGWAETSW